MQKQKFTKSQIGIDQVGISYFFQFCFFFILPVILLYILTFVYKVFGLVIRKYENRGR